MCSHSRPYSLNCHGGAMLLCRVAVFESALNLFGSLVHPHDIQVEIKYQGHWVKVTGGPLLIKGQSCSVYVFCCTCDNG